MHKYDRLKSTAIHCFGMYRCCHYISVFLYSDGVFPHEC